MKNKISIYRFLAVLLALLLLPAAAFAETETRDIAYPEKEAYVLSELGLIDSGAAAEEGKTFTRAELAENMVRVLNLSDAAWSGTLSFYDVPQNSEFYKAIGLCTAQGVLNGFSETSFGPDRGCTVAETTVVLMRALGYRNIAEKRGGYAAGYLSQAGQSGLLKGIGSSFMDAPCTNRIFAKLVYNMLTVKTFEVTGVKDNEAVIEKGEMYMKSVFDLQKTQGILEATRVTSIKTGTSCPVGYITVDGTQYRYTGHGADDRLGQSVELYYTQGTDSTPVAACVAESGQNEVTTIVKDDVVSISGRKIEYTDADDKTRTISLSVNVDILYNNLPDKQIRDIPNDGVYICIDNDGDGTAEVLRIEAYTNLFISSINKTEGVIKDVYSAANNISFNVNELGKSVFIYDENGTEIDTDGMEKDIVYSCVRSENDAIIVIRAVISETVGTVEGGEIENGSYKKLQIGGETYEVSKALLPHLPEITPGKTQLIVYRDAVGKVAAFSDVTLSRKQFAYLYAVKQESGLSGDVLVKLHATGFTRGEFKVFTCADKLTIDDKEWKLSQDKQTILSLLSAAEGQVITYELNQKEKVSKIGTIGGGSLISVGKDTTGSASQNTRFYRTIVGKVGLAADTVVMFVPTDGREENFKNGTKGDLVYEAAYPNYEGFVTDEKRVAAEIFVVPLQGSGSSMDGNAPYMLVTDTSRIAIGEDATEATKVTGYVGEALKTFTLEDDLECFTLDGQKQNVKKGDVIRYAADSSQYFSNVQILYSLQNDHIYGSNPSDSNAFAKPRVFRGKVYKKKDGFALFSYVDPTDAGFDTDDLDTRSLDGCAVFSYDAARNKQIQLGSIDDLSDYWNNKTQYSDVFGATSGTLLDMLVILK